MFVITQIFKTDQMHALQYIFAKSNSTGSTVLDGGDFVLTAVLDSEGEIDEAFEFNNRAQLAMSLHPDLHVAPNCPIGIDILCFPENLFAETLDGSGRDNVVIEAEILTPPELVNLMALPTRLVMTWRKRT